MQYIEISLYKDIHFTLNSSLQWLVGWTSISVSNVHFNHMKEFHMEFHYSDKFGLIRLWWVKSNLIGSTALN